MTQQRLDRVLDPTFVADLDAVSTAELRTRRAEVEGEEEAVSYVRRLLQGRLDILRAELLRRTENGNPSARDLLSDLSDVLADDGGSADRDVLKARATRLRVPPGIDHLQRRLDDVVDTAALEALPEYPLDTLRQFVVELGEHEQELSRLRRTLFEHLDALRDELAVRYKDGRAVIGDLLTEK